MTIRGKLRAGFGLVIALLAILTAFVLSRNLAVERNFEGLTNDTILAHQRLNDATLASARMVEESGTLVRRLLTRHRNLVADRLANGNAAAAVDTAAVMAALPSGDPAWARSAVTEEQAQIDRAIEDFSRHEAIYDGSNAERYGDAEQLSERLLALAKELRDKSGRFIGLIDARADLDAFIALQDQMSETASEFASSLRAGMGKERAELRQRTVATEDLIEDSTVYLLAFALLALLAAAVVSHVIGQQISRPVGRLREAAMRVGGGDFGAAEGLQDIKARDEIGDLASSFRRMVADLQEARDSEARQQRLAALGQVAGSVSHELRNPLATIENSVEIIRERVADKNLGIDRALDRLKRGIERCKVIISEVLEFSATRQLDREATAIDDWLGEMLDEHGTPPAVTIDRAFAAAATVMLDRTRFRQVLVNLVDNAVQAMTDAAWAAEAQRRPVIVVRTEAAGPHLRLTVADNGPGIPEDKLAKIFEPLFTTKAKGIGLGLPTVRNLVEQHGGTIAAESKVGEGTTFTIWLPRMPASPAAAAAGLPASAAA